MKEPVHAQTRFVSAAAGVRSRALPYCSDGLEDNLLAHVHLLHNLVTMPSCVLLARAPQTRQSAAGLCNRLSSHLSICSQRGELR